MTKLSCNRKAGILLAALCAFTTFGVAAESQTASTDPQAAPQTRQRWQDFSAGPDGAKRVASFEKAVQKMKSLDSADPKSADYRRSWAYWANIHGYYGKQSPDGTVQQQIDYLNQNGLSQYVPFYQGIVDQTPPDQTAVTTWATCQHSGQTQALNFFGWHRMYLYYFEQVLRWAAQDDTLRLPYWDYTDPAQLALPTPYQATTAVLYDSKRNANINTGKATLGSTRTNIDKLLTISDYFTYEKRIEEGVHGYVHCTVGPTCPVAHMGDVPVAGNDPVFYSHHANIDRMWACWQNLYKTPAGSWQDQKFSFPDATGTLQTRPVKEFLDPAKIGYVYDNSTQCSRSASPGPALAAGPGQGEKKGKMLGAKKSVAVATPLTQIEMGVPMTTVKSVMAEMASAERLELILRDVTAQSPPGVLFDVFVSKKGDPSSRKLAGTLSFFGMFRHQHGAADDQAPHGGMMARTFEFDVTDIVRQLGEGELMVEIEATDGRTMTDPKAAAESTKEAAKAFRADAKLMIGSIELKTTGNGPQG